MIDAGNPYRKAALIESLEKVQMAVADYFSSIPPERFNTPLAADAWSPRENFQHLILSVQPLARAMATPKSALALMFGKSAGTSRHYIQVRERYLDKLVKGAKATGRYVPKSSESADDREQLMQHWHQAGSKLVMATQKWKEADLDRVLLPHPVLGKIPAREMLMFTIYHNIHHTVSVEKRLKADGV